MKFATIAIIILYCITVSQAGRRRRYCGSRLVDQLRFICGQSGIRSTKSYHISQRYPNYRAGSSRKRSIEEIIAHLAFEHHDKSLLEAALAQPESIPVLEKMIRTARKMREEEKLQKRFARDVVSECCRSECTLTQIKVKYCGSSSRRTSK